MRASKLGLYLTSFLCGALIMVLEILGFRLLPPYLGYSIHVWGSLLGVVMVALSAGYYLGGFLVDRLPDRRILYALVLVAAGYSVLLLFAHPAIMRFAAGFGVVVGALLGTFLLFAVPMTSLSTASPFIIRLLAREGRVGSAAGTIYAISTVGSIVGTFGTSFYLIPSVGMRATLWVSCVTLAVLGGLGLFLASIGEKAGRRTLDLSPP